MNLLAVNCKKFRVDLTMINCSTLFLEKIADTAS